MTWHWSRREERLSAEDWYAEQTEEQRQGRTAQAVAVIVLTAAAVDVAIGLVVWAMLHCAFGGE